MSAIPIDPNAPLESVVRDEITTLAYNRIRSFIYSDSAKDYIGKVRIFSNMGPFSTTPGDPTNVVPQRLFFVESSNNLLLYADFDEIASSTLNLISSGTILATEGITPLGIDIDGSSLYALLQFDDGNRRIYEFDINISSGAISNGSIVGEVSSSTPGAESIAVSGDTFIIGGTGRLDKYTLASGQLGSRDTIDSRSDSIFSGVTILGDFVFFTTRPTDDSNPELGIVNISGEEPSYLIGNGLPPQDFTGVTAISQRNLVLVETHDVDTANILHTVRSGEVERFNTLIPTQVLRPTNDFHIDGEHIYTIESGSREFHRADFINKEISGDVLLGTLDISDPGGFVVMGDRLFVYDRTTDIMYGWQIIENTIQNRTIVDNNSNLQGVNFVCGQVIGDMAYFLDSVSSAVTSYEFNGTTLTSSRGEFTFPVSNLISFFIDDDRVFALHFIATNFNIFYSYELNGNTLTNQVSHTSDFSTLFFSTRTSGFQIKLFNHEYYIGNTLGFGSSSQRLRQWQERYQINELLSTSEHVFQGVAANQPDDPGTGVEILPLDFTFPINLTFENDVLPTPGSGRDNETRIRLELSKTANINMRLAWEATIGSAQQVTTKIFSSDDSVLWHEEFTDTLDASATPEFEQSADVNPDKRRFIEIRIRPVPGDIYFTQLSIQAIEFLVTNSELAQADVTLEQIN